jgi:Zn-dependent protease
MKFSAQEVKELAISALVIGFVFAYFLARGIPTISLFFYSLLGVGSAFIFHELPHKATAQRFGCIAEYRMWDTGLIIAFFLVVITKFLFIAPGAVLISGGSYGITSRQNGIISGSGAVTNIVLAVVFFLVIFKLGAIINAWLALFNMIPFPPLDGSKVIAWDKSVWAGV